MYKSNNFDKFELLEFDTIKDLLSLSCLVYNFNININLTLDSSNNYDLNKLDINNLKINNKRKLQLNEILTNSPNAELYNFYDLPSGTQIGITISHINKRIAFVFRGSNQLKDWLHDFLICKKHIKDNVYVHLGFYKSLYQNNLFNNLLEDYRELIKKYNDYDVYITGHSLGGGLSTLFGYLLSYETMKNITVVSFASPRVGNKEWSEDFNNKNNLRLYRVVNKRDIVTSVPYVYFYHVGNYIYIDDNKEMTYTISDLFMDYSNFLKSFNPFDHLIENYYSNLLICKWSNQDNYKITKELI